MRQRGSECDWQSESTGSRLGLDTTFRHVIKGGKSLLHSPPSHLESARESGDQDANEGWN